MKENPKLYEINTIVWLDELGRKYGKKLTIGEVPSGEWDGLKKLGFDYVWLMGVWKRGRTGIEIVRKSPVWPSIEVLFDSALPGWTDEDFIGSPYSIASYTPEPMMGRWEDIDAAREELHSRDMRLILDFVPNHTSPDHPWIFEHPEFYFQGSKTEYEHDPSLYNQVRKGKEVMFIARGKDPYFPAWPDTAQLNYFNPAMRCALLDELKNIAGHSDGVRCDMAMLVLSKIFSRNWEWAGKGWYDTPQTEFWKEVRDEFPELLLIAEAYWDTEYSLQQLGFDYVYDKTFYDCLINSSPHEIRFHLNADLSFQKKLVRFLENHDEPRSAVVFGGSRLFAAAAVMSTIPGMKLYYHGQIEGRRKQVPLFLKRMAREEINEEIKGIYERIFRVTLQKVFSFGRFEVKDITAAWDDTHENLVSYIWKYTVKADNILKLVIVNLSEDRSQGRVSLKDDVRDDGNYDLYDELNEKRYWREGKEMADTGLHIILDGFQAHIFDISPA